MDNLGYLFAAFAIIWAIVFGYMIFMQLKQRKLQEQVDHLQASLDAFKKSG